MLDNAEYFVRTFIRGPVCCLGNCDKAPALMIDDDTFGDVQATGVTQLLEGYP